MFDVAVNSSLSEGLSNTVIEYMASSKPVVATNAGGNSEVVIDGETGFIVSQKIQMRLQMLYYQYLRIRKWV